MNLLKELRRDFEKKIELKELRKFGFLIGAIFSIFGFFKVLHFTISMTYLGLIIIFFALAWPVSLGAFYRIWMSIGTILGFFTSRVILILLYCCIIMPIGFIMRVLKRDPIDKNIEKGLKTYWVKHTDD